MGVWLAIHFIVVVYVYVVITPWEQAKLRALTPVNELAVAYGDVVGRTNPAMMYKPVCCARAGMLWVAQAPEPGAVCRVVFR